MFKYKLNYSVALFDLLMLPIAWILTGYFIIDFHVISLNHLVDYSPVFWLNILIYSGVLIVFRADRPIWKYISLYEVVKLFGMIIFGLVLNFISILFVFNNVKMLMLIVILHALFYSSFVIFIRCGFRYFCDQKEIGHPEKYAIIIGAGRAAEGLIRDMNNYYNRSYKPIGLLDDNISLQGRSIHGVKIIGRCLDLAEQLDRLTIDLIVFAIPSLQDSALQSAIHEVATLKNIPVRILPSLDQIAKGFVFLHQLRPFKVEELLGRPSVTFFNNKLAEQINNKVILVTGGGGSIGSELCQQIAANKPHKLYMVDNCEYNLYKLQKHMETFYSDIDFEPFLANVASFEDCHRVIQIAKPHIVFHAAAYKHVPLLEKQILSAITNNVLATKYLVDICDKFGVESFVMVSTDKAVNPTNIMGLSKRLAEIYCQSKNNISDTNFITVRFGNVLGSAGSVLPLFEEQMKLGGPLTVTHRDMTRFFMTIPEATQLIIKSFLIGEGGEIFVLDMGKSVKILTLAEKLIKLSGKQPYKDIDIIFTGIRPGEKLYEELFYKHERLKDTQEEKIFKSMSVRYNWNDIELIYSKIINLCKKDKIQQLLMLMTEVVPEYFQDVNLDLGNKINVRDNLFKDKEALYSIGKATTSS